MGEIVNKVANSSLMTINLEEFYPKGERVVYDLKQNLWQEMVLREKDFREFIKTHNWEQYSGKHVAIHCTVDAIIPSWAGMLLATYLQPHAATVVYGDLDHLESILFDRLLANLNLDDYQDARIVVKGCSDLPVPESAYVQLTTLLRPIAKSLLFGEPCSTVPLYKRPKEK